MVTDQFLPGISRCIQGGFITGQEVTVRVDGIDRRRVWLHNSPIPLLVGFELLGCQAFRSDIDAGADDPDDGTVLISHGGEGGAPVAGTAGEGQAFVILPGLSRLEATAVIGAPPPWPP